MCLSVLDKIIFNQSWLRHLWLRIIPSCPLRHIIDTTRQGNPYHHLCYARNVPFLSKITTFIFFQTRRVPLIRFWILLRNDKFISTFWIKATFSAVALKNAPFKGRYRCQEFRRSLRKVICSIERNAFGNVHKWRATFFGQFWLTYLPCPTIYTLRPIFGGFLDPPTYPKIRCHLWTFLKGREISKANCLNFRSSKQAT